jgi:hypothetical protein
LQVNLLHYQQAKTKRSSALIYQCAAIKSNDGESKRPVSASGRGGHRLQALLRKRSPKFTPELAAEYLSNLCQLPYIFWSQAGKGRIIASKRIN